MKKNLAENKILQFFSRFLCALKTQFNDVHYYISQKSAHEIGKGLLMLRPGDTATITAEDQTIVIHCKEEKCVKEKLSIQN